MSLVRNAMRLVVMRLHVLGASFLSPIFYILLVLTFLTRKCRELVHSAEYCTVCTIQWQMRRDLQLISNSKTEKSVFGRFEVFLY
jgi:hypothetical protein